MSPRWPMAETRLIMRGKQMDSLERAEKIVKDYLTGIIPEPEKGTVELQKMIVAQIREAEEEAYEKGVQDGIAQGRKV